MKSKFLIIGLLLATGLFGQFEAPNLIIDGAGASDLALFDFDSDGDQDIIVVKQNPHFNSGYWYENLDGQGTFGLPIHIDHFRNPKDAHIEIADINGDGLLDIVSSTLWIENTGAVNGFIEHLYPVGESGNSFPADMDNDGDIDILRTPLPKTNISSGKGFVWMENTDGLGTFVNLPEFADVSGAVTYRGTRIINYDGDAFPDVITGFKDLSAGISGFRIWKNVGGTGTQMELTIEVDLNDQTIYEIASGDINNDGYDEFATVQRGLPGVDLTPKLHYYGNNSGTFSQGNFLRSLDAIYPQVEFVDLENSGTEGLVVLDDDVDMYYKFSPSSSMELFTGNTLPGSGGVGDFGDFNNDGKIDLVESSYVERNNATNTGDLYVNASIIDGSGDDPEEVMYHLREPKGEQVFDWDGSGSYDFIALEGGQTNKVLVWISNDGNGNFSEKKILNDDVGNMNDFRIADINQDGLNDVIVG